MNTRLIRNTALLLLAIGSGLPAASLRADFKTGQNYYFGGKFKAAISQFEGLVKADPRDADSYFWLGKSYAMLADINAPVFGARARSKARTNFRKAVDLAPQNADYRREFFDFLLDSDGSRSALKEARNIAQTARASLDYSSMQSRLYQQGKEQYSPEGLGAVLFLLGPEQAVRIIP